jgi:hypothetical protein
VKIAIQRVGRGSMADFGKKDGSFCHCSMRSIKQKTGAVSHPGEIGAIHEFQFPE